MIRLYKVTIHIAITMLFAILITTAFSQDWSSCESDLDGVRSAASNASSEASDASSATSALESKKDEMEDTRSELENCLMFPRTFDLYGDRCQSLRWDYDSARSEYESAKSDYESAVSVVQSEMSTLRSRIRSAESSSQDYSVSSFSASKLRFSGPKNSRCNLYRRLKGRFSDSTILRVCQKNMHLEECKNAWKKNRE